MTIEQQITNLLRGSLIGLRSQDIARAIERPRPSVRIRLAQMYDKQKLTRQMSAGSYTYKLREQDDVRA